MNTLYITGTGRVLLDENNNIQSANTSREGINNILHLKEDTKIVYNREGDEKTLDGKAGDIVVTFYEKEFPNSIIVVSSNEWKENLEAYEAAEQKRKEEWAKRNAENCDKCCDCECGCCPG